MTTPSLIKRAFRMAHKRMGTHIRFTRDTFSCELDSYFVIPGKNDVEGNERLSLLSYRHDFFVLAESLLFDEKPVIPEQGDIIIDIKSGRTYEVKSGPRGCWQYVDPLHVMIRIITQETTPCP